MKNLHNTPDWDFYEPNEGHEIRFLKKLEIQNNTPKKNNYNLYFSWAALFILSTCFAIYYYQNNTQNQDSDIPQNYFANQIELQITSLKELETPLTRPIIEDAISEILKLENDYSKLENERKVNGINDQLLNAMITNLQTRIDFLQRVQSQINQINELKSSHHEIII